ncbi:hypothetical protein RJ640_015430 [Escallonia rubra]|uniref:Nuclear transcription factor Y subunit n=1 Tax=Escallonia rubra TaxID=112253 RepID=A0AA88UW15_9ASTE|nr:hypothetical protein RJ640_015430 [Escallonia rubra]
MFIMPTRSRIGDRNLETGSQSTFRSTVHSQPWWYGVESSAMPSSVGHINGSVTMGVQLQVNDDGGSKGTHTTTGLNEKNGQSQQHLKPVASSVPPLLPEHLETNSQMELVGHSIVLTSYPYQDPHYGGIMAYGAQVNPHLLGIHQTRMPLPLEMEEEPVYVNAKQYHGILRRRQSRAKAELEKKVTKDKKPYLHESRHQHAMRRQRGCGGRFLNTKKLDSDVTNPRFEKEPNFSSSVSTYSANSANSEKLNTNCDGKSDNQGENGPMVLDMHKRCSFPNGNCDGHGPTLMYHFQLSNSEEGGDCFDREKGSLRVNQTSHGAAPVK